ncbi:MAG: helix-turn-helix domain-containing protein [Verrucomicrobia bacterium]|nr:helix-turn-helix domain-containing protein [Verrucomicrobiota bacterium]
MNTNGKSIVEALTNSKLFLDYHRAFGDMTGLPLALRPLESWQLPYHGRRNENAYCAMMASKSAACAACLHTQQRLSELAQEAPRTVTCVSGMCETAVPVRLGDRLVGLLQTGQVFRKKPTQGQFEHIARLVEGWELEVPRSALRRAYHATRVLSATEHDAVIRMLGIFAQHLALASNRLVMHQDHNEPLMVQKAKEFIQQHQSEELSLTDVAEAVNASTFYFCKVFKKATGINFTDYVSRVRIERAKNLALNPNLRISEIAFEVGFQSLTHFNRVFKRITGVSPTVYRSHLPTA